MCARTPSAHPQLKDSPFTAPSVITTFVPETPSPTLHSWQMSPQGSLDFEVFFEKNKTEANDLFYFLRMFMLRMAILFYLQYKWFTRAFLSFMNQFLFYKWWPFLKNTGLQDVDIYFFMFTWVRKRFYKKENEKLWKRRDRIKNCDEKRYDSV